MHSAKLGKKFSGIPEREMEKLMQLSLARKNVRELENVIERSAILSNGFRPVLPELNGFFSEHMLINAKL